MIHIPTEKLADFSLGLVYDDIPELAKIKAKDDCQSASPGRALSGIFQNQ